MSWKINHQRLWERLQGERRHCPSVRGTIRGALFSGNGSALPGEPLSARVNITHLTLAWPARELSKASKGGTVRILALVSHVSGTGLGGRNDAGQLLWWIAVGSAPLMLVGESCIFPSELAPGGVLLSPAWQSSLWVPSSAGWRAEDRAVGHFGDILLGQLHGQSSIAAAAQAAQQNPRGEP